MQHTRMFYTSLSIFTLVLLMLPACKQTSAVNHQQPALPIENLHNPYEVHVDPLFEVASISTSKAPGPGELEVSGIPRSNIYSDGTEWVPSPDSEQLPITKISPVLEQWLREMDENDFVKIIISFKEDLRIPLLPDLQPNEKRGDPNSQRAVAISALKRERSSAQHILLDKLKNYGRFQALRGFWIVNSVIVNVQIGEIKKLSRADFVIYLQPKRGGEAPPSDLIAGNDVEDGRARISSDPYFDLALTRPWVGLIDSGVRETHQLLSSNMAWLRDCVHGGVNCDDTTQPGYDTSDISNHGTSSAAILTGSTMLGTQFRGVTDIRTDSWKVYYQGEDCHGTSVCLDSEAVVLAIEAGIAAYDQVLVGELQANELDSGSIALAADNAYDSGVVFVAANGNSGFFLRTVDSPARAHKVLGVGAFDIVNGDQFSDQSLGPATDLRIKPDLQAPTNSETASSTSDSALHIFEETSGAAPYAAGAAMLSRNWLRRIGYFDNGQTYAFMILYGENYWPHDNIEGAGPIRMATDGWAWFGKVAVTHGLSIDIPINVMPGKQNFDLALWWPESEPQIHNNIDVKLLDPNGALKAESKSVTSIFERTGLKGPLTAGTWTVHISGFSVPAAPQTVYWVASVRN